MREPTFNHTTPRTGPEVGYSERRPVPTPSAALDSEVLSATRIVPFAIAFGVIGDQVLRGGGPIGIGPALWLALGWIALYATSGHRLETRRTEGMLVIGAGLLVAALLAWRDAEEFAVVTVFSTIALGVLAATIARGSPFQSLTDARAFDAIPAAARTFGAALIGAARLFSPLSRNESLRASGAGVRGPIIRGLVVTVPIAAIFVALFSAADRDFANLAERLSFDPGELAGHVVLAVILAWIAAGILAHAMGLGRRPDTDASVLPTLGRIELGMLLGTLNLIFIVFVALQLPHLFGGDALVQSAEGPTYAEYARRGFTELVLISGLTLGVLTGAQGLAAPTRETTRLIRALGGLLIALTFVVMQSAIHRLGLYTDAYGWTIDRLYAAAVIAWLALAFAWGAVTLLGSHPRAFLAGVVAAGVAVLVSLAALNPEGFVAARNLTRAQQGHSLDLMSLASLGRDAAPAIARGLPRVPARIIDEATLVKDKEDPCRSMHSYAERLEQSRSWTRWTIGGSAAESARPAIRTWTNARCGLSPARVSGR